MGRRSSDHHSHRSSGGHRHRHRARRGAVREAILILLDERPMHGYELITELEARSGGRWRPSAGAIYPALDRLADHGLVDSSDDDGKKRFALTDAGREALAELRRDRHPDSPAPWDDTGTGHRGDLRRHVAELVAQARQIGRFGDPDQIERAGAVFTDATRRLYEILATPGPGPTTDRAGDAGDTGAAGPAGGDTGAAGPAGGDTGTADRPD